MIPNRIAGKRAVITGGGSGIGRATAMLLARAGVALELIGRNVDKLLETQATIIGEIPGASVSIHVLDVRNTGAMDQLVQQLTLKPVDILVNNAGLALGLGPVDSYAPEDIDTVIDTDVKALIHMTRLMGAHFRAENRGHIVNIGSIAGYEAYPGGSVYNAAKFAVNGFNKALKMDFHGTGVRASAISPGMVETDFSLVRFHGDASRASKVYAGTTPLSPENIAELIYTQLNAPEHVNVIDLIVYPVAQSSATLVHRSI